MKVSSGAALPDAARGRAADDVIAGDSEMAARMRLVDWSVTPLGPVGSWPQSLKTCVRIVLTSRQPMFVWWGDALINLYNDAYKTILGGKHPGALGQPASEVWRELWDEIGPRAQSTMRGTEGTYDEALLLIMQRYGYLEETYYTFSYSPVPNDQGGIGGLICANTDETQRIIGERQMALLREMAARNVDARTTSTACALSVQGLETNARDLPFALIYLLDPDGKGLSLAGAAGIASGDPVAPMTLSLEGSPWPLAEVLGTREVRVVADLGRLFDDLPMGAWDLPPSEAAVVPFASTRSVGILVAGLNPFRRWDKAYQDFLALVAGQISSGIVNAQGYEDERRRAQALAELDRAKTAFFSNVSHEFRTPLTLMLGPTEDAIATSGALSGPDLETVHRNQLRLLKLVNSMLDFSRIEAGRVEVRHEATNLAGLTTDLASTFRSAIERGGLRFEVECPPNLESVYIDPEMWEKIVLNLLSNAFKFTFEGAIQVLLHDAGDNMVLNVKDTGVGIPEDQLPQVFERFHRVEGSHGRTHEGSGIGLALVREMVLLHGGSVHATSTLGAGTAFTVSIPKAHPKASANAASVNAASVNAEAYVEEALRWLPDEASADRVAGGMLPGDTACGVQRPSDVGEHQQCRVLVVDDNADMRGYLRRLLGARWLVETAANGLEALRAARQRRPDVILTDVMMPELDGFGLLKALRADPDLQTVPIMMLSARAGQEARIEGVHAGADDYVVKPFSSRELVARVEAQLLRAELRAVEYRQRRQMAEVFNQAPAAVALLRGPMHVFEVANPAYLALVGQRDIVGNPIRQALPEFEGQGAIELLDQVYRTGQPYVGSALRVLVQRSENKPPHECFFDFVYQPMRDRSGHVDGIAVVAFDVSELAKARRIAEAASRAKDEFLAMLGHELRNPLAPILTAVEVMRLRGADVLAKERAVIERQARHLVRLVDDLLDVSRMTSGKIELKKERVELADVVALAIETASPLIERHEHELFVDTPSRGLALVADPDRLVQVIANLLSNAASTRPRADGSPSPRSASATM